MKCPRGKKVFLKTFNNQITLHQTLKKIICGICQSLGVIYHTVYLIFYTVKLQHSYQYTGMVNNTIWLTLCDTVLVWRSRLTSMVISSIQMLRQTLQILKSTHLILLNAFDESRGYFTYILITNSVTYTTNGS